MRILIGLLLCAAPLAGCTTTETQNGGVNPAASLSSDSETQLQLPEMVAMLPSSAERSQDAGDPQQVAALTPGETAEAAPLLQPAAFAGMPRTPVEPVALPAIVDKPGATEEAGVATDPASHTALDTLIAKYAALYEVPEGLVRRVVKRESNFSPTAYNNGHWGLMQIKHATARGMGYAGSAKGLLDADTNLKFAVKYLRGAYLVARGDHNRADRLYQTGYYYDAKRMGLLEETGLGKDRRRKRI